MCGENLGAIKREVAAEGSSPRVRGTVDSEGDEAGGGDLIPTCAGNGEVDDEVLARDGSSPRVRGKRR